MVNSLLYAIFDKMLDEGQFENDKTLENCMDFIDNFAPSDAEMSRVFTAVLTDCVVEYQRLAFAKGFKACYSIFLEAMQSGDKSL